MIVETAYLADHPQFVPQIATWYFDEWGHKEPSNSMESTLERLHAKLNSERLPIPIIALAHGRLLGTAQLKLREMDIYPEKENWLGGVYVDPLARHQHIAELLVKRVEEIAKQRGISQLFLQTKRLDGGLYTRLGWEQIEQVRYKGNQILLMRKELNR